MMSGSKKKPRNQQTEVLELNENENTAQQNLWDTSKAALQREFIGLNLVPTVKKGIRKNTKDFMLQLRILEKQKQTKYKLSQQQELIKIRA